MSRKGVCDKDEGLSRNKVAVPEGAAGTPPFWRGRKIDKVFVLVLLVLFIQDMIP